jgi:hypothetical protein
MILCQIYFLYCYRKGMNVFIESINRCYFSNIQIAWHIVLKMNCRDDGDGAR